MLNSPHRIRRLRWKVTTSIAGDAFVIRKQLYEEWQDLLETAFEKVFNEAADAESLIHIPKIELNLTVTSQEELAKILPDLLEEQLREQLHLIIQEKFLTNRQAVFRQNSTVQQNQFEILLDYLHTGSMSWQAAYSSTSQIAVALQETCRQQWLQVLDYLRHKSESIAFYFRLMQLISQDELLTLVTALSENLPNTCKSALVQLITSVLAGEQRLFNRYTQLKLVAGFLSESLTRQASNVIPDFTKIADSLLSQEEKNTLTTFIGTLPPSIAVLFQSQKGNVSTFVDNSISQTIDSLNHREIPSQLDTETIDSLNHREIPSELDANPDIIQREMLQNMFPLASDEDEFPLAVKYAGLVLIHPFITRLFEHTGIKQTGQKELLLSETSRAAALLQFLATGSEEVYEYELGFIKILLGLHPETPLLVSEGLIQPSDKEEAEVVLRSLISYWSVLKNTSIDGLRSSFLQRQGLVRETEGSWKIQVETQSFDMLLAQLPWSISTIKFSWMKKPIYTEWQLP